MRVFKRRLSFKATRNVRVFLYLEAGLTHHRLKDDGHPSPETRKHGHKLWEQIRRRIKKVRGKLRERKKAWRLAQLENERRRKKKRRLIAKPENEPARNAGTPRPVGLNSRRRNHASKTLLVSFCNVGDKTKPVLASVNLCEDGPEVRWIEIKEDGFVSGAMGLCFWNERVCVAHQGGPETSAGFVLLDPNSGFDRVHEGALPHLADVHSVCFRDGALYFVASGRDSVYRATLDSRTGEWACTLYWTFPGSSGKSDENHINAIDCVGGELYVSGFGKRRYDESALGIRRWLSASRGFVYNIERDEYLLKDIYHPHSLLGDSGTIWICESERSKLLASNGEEYDLPLGYARGLAISEEGCFYVGVSKQRVTDKLRGEYTGNCGIYKLGKQFGEPRILVDFSKVRNEIYDVVLL